MKSIELNCGCSIKIGSIYQFQTYEGLLAGIPNTRINQRIISRAKSQAEKYFPKSNTVLINPTLKPIRSKYRENTPLCVYEQLPSIICIGSSWSNKSVKSSDSDGSHLTIIWFQDKFAFPIHKIALEGIKNISWLEIATDYYL